jgi:hypothetical protein
VRSVTDQVLSLCPSWRALILRRNIHLIIALVAVLIGGALSAPKRAAAQVEQEQPLLPTEISAHDIEMRGRYVRQWREDGSWVVMFTGGFSLDMGQRHLSANAAVVWIKTAVDAEGRRYSDLTVYLSENACVRELGGTTIEDNVLLVSNLRTYGKIIKYSDVHSPESGAQSPLYQQALRGRAEIESGAPPSAAAPPAVAETPAPGGIAVARPGQAPPEPEAPSGIIRYDVPSLEPARTAEGLQVYVAVSKPGQRVYFSRAGGPKSPMLEILADSAVIFPAENFARGVVSGEEGEQGVGEGEAGPAKPAEGAGAGPVPEAAPAEPPPEQGPLPTRAIERNIRAVYLEGDVLLTLGTSFIRACRLYYDFERDRATILDAVFRTELPERNIPLYLRADEIRQLSARQFEASNAKVTTSEFYTPHYYVGAECIDIADTTPRDAEGRAIGKATGEYTMRDATFNVGGVPLLWWPYVKGTFEESETSLKRVRAGYEKDFGAELETEWYLFNLLGIPEPEGFDTTWRLDYYSRRGPGTGVDITYQRPTNYGLFRGYYIHDEGEDNLGPLRKAQEDPSTTERGRILWRHRHYLPDDWELTLEAAYFSDKNFLEEYDPAEYFEGKQEEMAFYLKRARGNEAITLLSNWRMLESYTQTEHRPELAYRRIGDTCLDPLVMYHESRFGMVTYKPAELDWKDLQFQLYQERYAPGPIFDRNYRRTDSTARGDVRQEFELPLKAGAYNFVPFATVRATYWDGQPRDTGDLWRGLGVAGVRASTIFSRVYDSAESALFDIHRIRHIIKPEIIAWGAGSNVRSDDLTPFTYGIETIDPFYGVAARVAQTWQTKRGPPGKERSVDVFTLNLGTGFFGNAQRRHDISDGWADPIRPENSWTNNYISGDAAWRISDTTSLLYDFNIDTDEGQLDRHDVSFVAERTPRLSYVLGYREAKPIDLEMIGGGWNYKLNEKYTSAVRGWYDLSRGDVGEVTLAFVRKLPRWYVSVSLAYDAVEDDYSISFSIWPEGVPEWALGPRRFVPLGTSTGIRPRVEAP